MPTPRVTIPELPEQTTIEAGNFVVIDDSGTMKRVSVTNLLIGPVTAIADHLADGTDAHDASSISAPAGTVLTGTDVGAQLLAADTAISANTSGLAAHIADATAAHAASAIAFTPTGSIAATDVQAAIEEVATEAAGGTVDTIVAGTGIEVDDTDAANPEVGLTAGAQASLALADTAVQPADIPPTIVESVAPGAGIDVDITDPTNPVVSVENPIAAAATADTIALRGASGVLLVGTPTVDGHAATKLYVDTEVAAAGGISEGEGNDNYVRRDGTNTMDADFAFGVGVGNPSIVSNNDDAIRLRTNGSTRLWVSSVGIQAGAGVHFQDSVDPSSDNDLARKAYVDDGDEIPIIVALSPELDAPVNDDVVVIRSPYACDLVGVRLSCTSASTTVVTSVTVFVGGVEALSTPVTIDINERTSVTAATPPVIGTPAIADDAEIELYVNTVGADTSGLKITLYLRRT